MKNTIEDYKESVEAVILYTETANDLFMHLNETLNCNESILPNSEEHKFIQRILRTLGTRRSTQKVTQKIPVPSKPIEPKCTYISTFF